MNPPRWLPAALAASVALVGAVLLLVLLAVDDDSAPAPAADPAATTDAAASDPPPTAGERPAGFDVVTLRATQADGTVLEWCVWHADSADQRRRGLMEVTDLGDPVGMAFSYDEPVDNTFHMFGTSMPLSIAWFAADGGFVGATDMEPCAERNIADCARYSPGQEYTLAVEVPRGELPDRGLVAGSQAELVDRPCP